ncbi:helix-turn-helix transcriptional regulator [Zwartia panacis]|uniref:helix-turn-helix transcriptional regulator n=1 Tax=Zwartia panacis TaxID=2683345 RepID=UPI0025B2D49C|nr:AlpA family phage regulatory protein [Zwartia panacis]MDN4016193.1 AlpA family phage regulatory protein [Zwartia panacis]
MTLTSNGPLRFVSLSQVINQTSLGKSTIALWEADGRFPKAVRLCRTKRVWLESDIDSWMRDQYNQKIDSEINGLSKSQPISRS